MIVVDSSVAAKWLVPEDGSDLAEQLLKGSNQVIAPELLLVELGNFLWKAVRLGKIALEAALTSLPRVEAAVSLVSSTRFCPRALQLAHELAHPIYDCLYLAVAEEARCKLVTADMRVLRAVRASKYAEQAIPLEELGS
jgi:predicted nucleic acid-binding protein